MKNDDLLFFLAFCVGVIVTFAALRGLVRMETQQEWCERWAHQTVDKPFKEAYQLCQNHMESQKR